MSDSIRGSLPPIYSHLFHEFFDRPKVVETRATCDKCAMCNHGEPTLVPMEYFDESVKCCTFWPILPNYLVGSILSDETPEMAEGKRRVKQAIANRIGVAPYWLSRPRKLSLLMLGYSEAFGRAKSLRCPYFDEGNLAGSCTIWRHRDVICHTYHCRYVGGMRGYEYWNALKSYLSFVQRSLAQHAATAVDPKVIEPQFKKNTLTVEDMEGLPPKESDYKAWWGKWVGREEEFYVRCYDWVKHVAPEEFVKNVDEMPEGKRLLGELIAKYELLDSKVLPKSLVRNARMREQHVGEKVVVTSYHRYDSVAIDKDLFEVVGMFRADQTLEENLERLDREEGIQLTPELVEYLFAAGVLIEPTRAKVAEAKEVTAENVGELNGRRVALRAILEARGLTFDAEAKAKVDAADIASLDLWIRKAAIAATTADALKS